MRPWPNFCNSNNKLFLSSYFKYLGIKKKHTICLSNDSCSNDTDSNDGLYMFSPFWKEKNTTASTIIEIDADAAVVNSDHDSKIFVWQESSEIDSEKDSEKDDSDINSVAAANFDDYAQQLFDFPPNSDGSYESYPRARKSHKASRKHRRR